MIEDQEPTTLEQLLDQVDEAARNCEYVSVATLLQMVGHRSFGPLLLLAGLITLAPIIGDIPGVPTIIGTLVLLISVQLLFHRKHIWLPGWLLKRSVKRDKASKAIKWTRRPARVVDRLLRPRLGIFIEGAAFYIIAVICILIAGLMPAMEIIPFSANAAGAALTAMGLALISRDGVLALIGIGITVAAGGLVIYQLL